MSHPLNGSNAATLFKVARQSGWPSGGNLLNFAGICGAVAGRTPFSWLERAALAPLLPKSRDMPPPIFILGHWRSGTTHLYNIMSLGDFSYVPPVATGIPWDFIGLGSLLKPLIDRALPSDRYIDSIPVTPRSPQEDEIALASMTPISFYHGLYFPSRFDFHLDRGLFLEKCSEAEVRDRWRAFDYFARKIYFQQRKPLLIKNPVYTGCVSQILERYPDAKFIHIHRNPFDVFLSMRNFYQKLLPVMALQDYSHVDIDGTVIRIYKEVMQRFEEQTAGLEAPQFVELGYDELDRDPMTAVQRVYEGLELEGFAAADPVFRAYLATVKSYRKNVFKGTRDDVDVVEREWAHFISKWNYQVPDIASVPS